MTVQARNPARTSHPCVPRVRVRLLRSPPPQWSRMPRFGRDRAPSRSLATLTAFTVLLFAVSSRAVAQTSETLAPFDSVGRVRSIAPSLAARLGLQAPAWPVTGAYTEARLYAVSTGGFVLVVDRGGGRLDRYALSDDERMALAAAIASGMVQAGRVVGEVAPTMISAPARGQFIRNQMLLSALVYGPAVSALTHDAQAGAAAYLLTAGGSFFYLANLSKHV